MRITVGTSTLSLVHGDITVQDTEAIVNAANSSLLGGGGVDGAIHRAGGPAILEECKAIRKELGECPTGEAVITTGGNLRAKYVIHTVGPVWRGGQHNEDHLLGKAYRNSLRIVLERNIPSIAFPSISTGIYGFPIERASRIAFTAVADFVREHKQPKEVRFVVFSKHDFDVYAPLFKTNSS
jgi:O-acetyl-ADP-ribose deacetylase (regulator of RNase III)